MYGFINNVISVWPAYGRSYKTKAELLADFDAEKDFKIESGPYFSKRDINQMKADGVQKLVFFNVKNQRIQLTIEL